MSGRPTARAAGPETRLLRRATWRLGLQVAGSCAVIVLVLVGLALFVVLRGQQTAADGLLRQAAISADGTGDPPDGTWLIIRGRDRSSATGGLPAGLPVAAALRQVTSTGVAENDQVTIGGAAYEVYTARRGGETVQAVLDLAPDDRERGRLLTAMLLSGGLGLVLSALAGTWFGRRAVRPLAGALALQRRFISDAGHELRTPLTLLTTRAQMHRRHLRNGVDPAVLTDEADGVVVDASHLTDIVEDLLLAADNRPLTETLDLALLAEQAVAAAAPAATEQGIAITTSTARPDVFVLGTRGGLRRALVSLLDNAVRHARAAVEVTVYRRGPDVLIDVADDGPGIDPSVLPHLFERFVTEPEQVAERRRYGIGLALVSEIAARHGGSISAHHDPNGGSTLRLTLPAHIQS